MSADLTSFASLRVERRSGEGKIEAMFGHNTRSALVPNADTSTENVTLVAFDGPASPWTAPSPWDAIQNRIRVAEEKRQAKGLKVSKQRPDAVQALEVVLTASPQYFRPGRPKAYGVYEPDRLAAWRKAVEEWLRETYGNRLIDARLHLDEATPHIHAVVVPLTDDGRLSAREVFNGRKAHRELQTSYAAAIAHLGIERGIEGSKAEHQRVKAIYGSMGEPDPEPPSITVPVPPWNGRVTWAAEQNARIKAEMASAFEAAALPGKLAKRATREKNDARELAAEKRRELQQVTEKERRTSEKARAEVDSAWQMAYRADAATETAREATRSAQEALEAERRDHTARMRDIPLQDVLRAAGWDLDPQDRNQWLGPDQGRISLKGAKWFDHAAGKGGGKAIDLVKHLTGQDFEGALGWLSRHFGDEPARAALRAKAEKPEPLPPPRPFELPAHDPEKIPEVCAYLHQERGLPERMIDSLLKTGKLLAENYRGYVNAVFVMRDEARRAVGAEKRGISSAFSGLAAGSSRNEGRFQVTKGGPDLPLTTVVATESAIDAISAHKLMPVPKEERWAFVSTAGARPNAPWLRAMIQAGQRLFVAFDADETGESMAEAMIRAYPTQAARLVPPVGKDWNDTLLLRNRGGEQAEQIDQAIREQLDETDEATAAAGLGPG